MSFEDGTGHCQGRGMRHRSGACTGTAQGLEAAFSQPTPKNNGMRIAVPVADGHLARHFGHCEEFVFLDVDPTLKEIKCSATVAAPEHEPGRLPGWLKEQGVSFVIAGGIGARAQALLETSAIGVLPGAPPASPETLVRQYLDGVLVPGANACDH